MNHYASSETLNFAHSITHSVPWLQNITICTAWQIAARSMCKILTRNRASRITWFNFLNMFITAKKKRILCLRMKYFELMTCALSLQWIVGHRSIMQPPHISPDVPKTSCRYCFRQTSFRRTLVTLFLSDLGRSTVLPV